MGERVCVIVNPAAGRGRGATMIPEITARFAEVGVTDIRVTSAKGEERSLTVNAIAEGCTTIVAVGGDGTSGNVASAILSRGGHARLAVVPGGTGNDFSKTLGAGAAISEVARLATQQSDVRVDVGRVEENYFLNCCGFGFDVTVLEELERTRWIRGKSLYLYAALRQLFRYRGTQIGITSASGHRPSSIHLMLVIANARSFGGSFLIAPRASVTDGELDAVSILDMAAHRRISMLAAAARGLHERYVECTTDRSPAFTLFFASPPSYETDGELRHASSATIEVGCLPAALRVVTRNAALAGHGVPRPEPEGSSSFMLLP